MGVMDYLPKEPKKYHPQLTNKTEFKLLNLKEI